MKITIISLLLSCFQFLAAQKIDTAQGYLKFIDVTHTQVVSQTWDYMEAYTARENPAAIKGQRKRLENIINKSIKKVESTKAFDKKLQADVLKYLKGNLSIVKNQFLQIIESDNQDPLSINQIEFMQQIRRSIIELREDYDRAIINYGKQHDIKIIANDGKLAKQMNNTVSLYDYFHSVQIEFLKLQRADRILWTDINDKSIASLKKDALTVQSSLLQLENIEHIGGYKSDESLIMILKDMNNYLKTAINEKLEPIYVIKKDRQTGNRDQIMNKTVRYNKVLSWSNNMRKRIYGLWNTTYPTFLQKHIYNY